MSLFQKRPRELLLPCWTRLFECTARLDLGCWSQSTSYEICLCHELAKMGLPFHRQLELPIIYDGITIESNLRLDVLVDDCVVVELKAVEQLISLYEAQVMTYLKLAERRLALLINFNVNLLKDRIKRIVL